MPDFVSRGSSSDRVRVFVSSTIVECASERQAARRAILGLNFEPILFEKEGARAEPPREFYIRKLHDSHIVIAIYRNSYGWIDEQKGMAISGLEDEYKEAKRLGKDFLAYVMKSAPDRQTRLVEMLEELKAGPHVLYFFEDGEDLEGRIRDDLTALVTERLSRGRGAAPRSSSAASVVDSIFRGAHLRVRRTALHDRLALAVGTSRVVWLTGAAGAGKTALAAEWADERGAAYVSARGLDPRSVVLASARSLGLADEAELGTPVFEDARALLAARWQEGKNWPLVLDDPDDLGVVWSVVQDCMTSSATGSVILIARNVPPPFPGERIEVAGFTDAELQALRAIAGVGPLPTEAGDLPLTLRTTTGAASPSERFEGLNALSREALGYIALASTPIDLDDLQQLLGQTVETATNISDQMQALDDLIMETPTGYIFVHDTVREQIVAIISARRQLHGLLVGRLSDRLAQTDRAWAAFALRRREDPVGAVHLASQAAQEAVFTGSMLHLLEALEYQVEYYRESEERGALISSLFALAEARDGQGRAAEAALLLSEALAIASQLGDEDAIRSGEILQASLALRGTVSTAALSRIRELRASAEKESRETDQGRLLLEEGIAFLGINDYESAIPLFRKSRDLFERIDDSYGFDVSTRNLIVSLAMNPLGQAESERLRSSLHSEPTTPRYRAWLCNLMVPRLRQEQRYDEAENLAREAIGIGKELGDQYLVAINNIVLGNVLRAAGKLDDALAAYSIGGQMAQAIGRKDIEGRSSRLLALTENTKAELETGNVRRECAGRAEQFADHAILLLTDSFAWVERAHALEERGDARRILAVNQEWLVDYADAINAFLVGEEVEDAERLLRFFLGALSAEKNPSDLIARAFGAEVVSGGPSESGAWVSAVRAVLAKCPKAAAPGALGVLVRGFLPMHKDDWWFHCLVRCWLIIDRDVGTARRNNFGSLLLLAVLGFSPYRDFKASDLLTLAGLGFDVDDQAVVRHYPNGDFDVIVWLGTKSEVLITVRTEGHRPESVFVALVIGAFLNAFGDELNEILFSDGLIGGAALDVAIFSQSSEAGHVAELMGAGLQNTPVCTARFDRPDEEEVPIVLFVRADAMKELKAQADRGGELEIMLAKFIAEILHSSIGGSLDAEIYRSKVTELLLSVLR